MLEEGKAADWQITVADYALQLAEEKVQGSHIATAVAFNINDEAQRTALIYAHDVVVSMLPAKFHPMVAGLCLQAGKHLFTASYVSDDMRVLDEAAKKKAYSSSMNVVSIRA